MRNNLWYLQVCTLFIISSLPLQRTYAEVVDSPVESPVFLKGQWIQNVPRSIFPIPFIASISNSQLTLECTAPNYDIYITIIDTNGKSVWQRNVTAPETTFVSISLNGWSQGSYTLIISNDYGGYLQGTFQL